MKVCAAARAAGYDDPGNMLRFADEKDALWPFPEWAKFCNRPLTGVADMLEYT